jgi:hypothetical protein
MIVFAVEADQMSSKWQWQAAVAGVGGSSGIRRLQWRLIRSFILGVAGLFGGEQRHH